MSALAELLQNCCLLTQVNDEPFLLIAVAYLLFLSSKYLESKISALEEWKQNVLLISAFALMVELIRHGYAPKTSYRW